jgi:hypothetical protein
MNYREQYAKQTAIQMYAQGNQRDAVVVMLRKEGAGEKANELEEEYYQNYVFITNYHKNNSQKSASMYITIGWVLIAGSLVYSLLMYLLMNNGSTIVLTSLLIGGVISLAKGLLDKRK